MTGHVLWYVWCVTLLVEFSGTGWAKDASISSYIPGEVLVKFKPGVPEDRIRDFYSRRGVIQKNQSALTHVRRLKLPAGLSVEETTAEYRGNPDVEYAEPNYTRRAMSTPNDQFIGEQWGLHNSGQFLTGTSPILKGKPDADIDALEAWNIVTGSPNLVVAVIDSGVDYTHSDLSANMWANPVDNTADNIDEDLNGYTDDIRGWNFVSQTCSINPDGSCNCPLPATPSNDPMDDNGHGTAAAGIIAGRGDNSEGIAGVLWAGKIMPLKFLDGVGCGNVGDEIQAIDYAVQKGAKIISINAGGTPFQQPEFDAIAKARDAGILVIAPAGNGPSDNDAFPVYPAGYDLPNVISVAASDFNDNLAYFSNYGKNTVDLAAPGDCIFTTMPTSSFTLQSPVSYAAGTGPTSIAAGDFNGDGKPDLAVANNLSNEVSILLGNGDGTFGAATNYAAGTGPTSIAVGDFNGDGKPDLAVANGAGNNVSIFLNTGTGTFGAATNYAAGTGPTSIAAGDFNGDGKPDLAVANGAGNNVSIFLNTGIGTFGAATNYAAGSNPTSVAIGDLDGDGKPDLAVANGADNNVSIFLNTGTGTFGAAMNYSAGSNPTSVAVGDFSGDGVPDLAVANGAGNNVSILPGKGTGTFGTATNYSAGSNPSSIASGDFNPDGKLDLAVVNNSSNEVSILLGTGTGTFYLQSKTNFSCAQDRNFTKEYDYISGTSFAASFVAGIAGLLLIQDPSLTPPDLKAILVSTVDAKNSLKGALISAGRVNANRALTRDLGATFSGGQRESVACGRIDPGGDGPASPGTGAASLLVMALPMLLASRSVRKVLQRGRWSLFFFVIIAPLPVQHWMSTAVYAQTPEDTQMTHQLALKMGFHLYRSSQYFNTNAAFFDEKDLTSVAEELEYDYLWFSPSSLALAVGYYDGRTDFKTICCSEIKFSNLYALATLKFHIKPVKLKPLEFYFGPGLGYNHFERRITVLNTSDSITRRAFDLHFVVGAQMRLGTRLSLILESRYASATIDNANNLDDKLNIGGLTTFLGVAWQYPDLRHFFPTRIAEPSEQMAGLKPAEVTEERVIPPVEKPLEERPEPEEKVPVGVGPTAELGLNEIHFGYDDWIIAEKERSILENDARWLQTHPDVKVVLEGHCDERGTNEYNLALGQRRAEAVKRVLITLGISESRLSVVSYGEERPVCFEETEECFAKNRRVQFTTQ